MNNLIRDKEIIFKISVIIKRASPKAKADSVAGELNAKSPTSEFTMVTVAVVISSNGFKERLGLSPAAITTIIVSPKAFEKAKRIAEIMPGIAEGRTILFITSLRVNPKAKAAFL